METLKFTIQSLLSRNDGTVSGPMSPTLFAQEMAKSVGFKYNRLARVWFGDEQINQCKEDGGLTGHDTLIIGAVYTNDIWLSLWVDSGTGGIPVAMTNQSDRIIDFTTVYDSEKFARKLNEQEVAEISIRFSLTPFKSTLRKNPLNFNIMGEYVKYKGTSIKLGTCEDLYYANYPKYIKALKAGLLVKEIGNDKPENYAKPCNGYRFRFPFPDEDEIPLGNIGDDNFHRGLLITIERGELFPKEEFPVLSATYEIKSRTQPGLVRKLLQANPNNVMRTVDLEVVQQKLIQRAGFLRLALVYRCPYSGEQWRLEDKTDAEFITAQITERYINTTEDEQAKDFWRKVNERISQGYYHNLIEQ
jgi:hypothetical protein